MPPQTLTPRRSATRSNGCVRHSRIWSRAFVPGCTATALSFNNDSLLLGSKLKSLPKPSRIRPYRWVLRATKNSRKPLPRLAIASDRATSPMVLLSGKSRFNSWRGHGLNWLRPTGQMDLPRSDSVIPGGRPSHAASDTRSRPADLAV